jgi:hypothetical protein
MVTCLVLQQEAFLSRTGVATTDLGTRTCAICGVIS